jgi:predicted transposase/invertase (TIGR01784 family)
MLNKETNKLEKKLNPHDKYFKVVFSYQEHIKAFLQHFLPDLIKNIDLETLTLDTNSYVNENLDEYFTDIVWRVKVKNDTLNICFLLEHKSYIDSKIREQIEGYMRLMWDKQAQQAKERDEEFKRFPIVPIVFYHGEANWELGRLPKGFEHFPIEFHRFIPQFEIILLNLQNYPENQIVAMGLGLLENALLLFKNCKNEKALLEKSALLWHNFKEYYAQNDKFKDFIKASIQYFLQNFVSNSSNQALAMDRVQNHFAEPTVRTLYDVIMDEAELRGESRGIQIGKIETLQETIASMWEEELQMPKIAKFTHLTIEEVQTFMRRIVGTDNMQLIEQQWKDGLIPNHIAGNMNMDVAFIQRIINYVLDYKVADDSKKLAQQ